MHRFKGYGVAGGGLIPSAFGGDGGRDVGGGVRGVDHSDPFEGVDTLKTPLGGNDALDENFFETILGVEEVAESAGKFVVIAAGFVGEYEGMGNEAVLETVERGAGFAARGFGAVGLEPIGPGRGFLFVSAILRHSFRVSQMGLRGYCDAWNLREVVEFACGLFVLFGMRVAGDV